MYRRHELDAGVDREHGNLMSDGKGKDKWVTPIRMNTDALIRGGVARSSDEGPVMGLERRGGIIEVALEDNSS